MYTSTEVHGVQGSGRFLFYTHWLNPLVFIALLRIRIREKSDRIRNTGLLFINTYILLSLPISAVNSAGKVKPPAT